jgi:hypothetical protein
MGTEEIGKHGMRRKLVTSALCAEAVEVSVVGVLEHLGCDDCWHKDGIPQWAARRLNPDGHVDGDVEEKTKKPVGKGHGALAGRGIDVRFQHATQTLEQQEGPHYLLLPLHVPDMQGPCPEERAGYRGEVEVGEVVVGDLQRGSIVESLGDGRRGLLVLPVLRRRSPGHVWCGRTGAIG